MKEFLIYTVKSGVLISLFLLIYQLFLRRTTLHGFKRFFLLLGIILSVTIPFIHYQYEVVVPVSSINLGSTTVSNQPPPAENSFVYWIVLVALYTIGSLVVVVRSCSMIRRLYLLVRTGEQIKRKGYTLVDHPDIEAPFTAFTYIFAHLARLSETEKEIILNHEKIHIAQKHWIDLLLSECMLTFQWFNPLMWKYVDMQKENHEFLADQTVLNRGTSLALYQAVLINQEFGGPVFSFASLFTYSNHLNRLRMLKKEKSSRWRMLAVLAILPVSIACVWASASPHYSMQEVDSGSQFEKASFVDGSKYAYNTKEISIIDYQEEGEMKLDGTETLIIQDGKEISAEELNRLASDEIEFVDVLKGEMALEKYGEAGRNGVILVTMKKGYTEGDKSLSTHKTESKSDSDRLAVGVFEIREGEGTEGGVVKVEETSMDNSLIYIDGEESNHQKMNGLSPDQIESVTVLKVDDAISQYGEKGKNGVILVTTKK